jgi:NAD(P)-dependent dehydrogenase (short-subunit alcohol dehydrogenase family)
MTKTALITGGSRGIGKSIALKLAEQGINVIINYANNDVAAKNTVEEIIKNGGQADAIKIKLTGQKDAEELASLVLNKVNNIDILVNNIGGSDYGNILKADEQFFDEIMNNNVKSAFFLTRAFYHNINDGGRVINISSAGARITDPNIIVYTMAKNALNAFTRVMAADLGSRGITVNSISPGFTIGETTEYVTNDPAMLSEVLSITALNRLGKPEEIAEMASLLCSNAGKHITAQIIEISGGFKL